MIMLTFETNHMEGIYVDVFPVVWKVSKFGKTENIVMKVAYSTYRLAFSKPQVVNGNIIDAETCVKINDGEKTNLTVANGVHHFSPPQPATPGVLQAVNNTGIIQDLTVSFMTPRKLMPKPIFYFNGVGDGSHVTAWFTPILHTYITSDYQKTTIIQGAIDMPVIWMQDLSALPESTTWTLTHDTVTGHYALVQS
ncbi:hypothetical protein BDR04DRAFT_1079616 [Suillus decipiens]|nr:hypothetical protein BDR04DRAFT_1079616 [Suillus decipiens]